MGLFGGSSSASSSSTNNSNTWNSQTIEDWLNTQFSSDINYDNESLLDLNPYLQNFLNYETSSSPFNTAKNVIGAGGQVFGQGMQRLQNAANVSPQDMYAALVSGTKGIYSSLNGFMTNEDNAIQNQVMAEMGSSLASNAETMNSGAVAGSSAMNNSAMGIMESGAESMEQQESDLAASLLKSSARAVNNMAGSYAKAQSGVTNAMLGIGSNIIKGGAKMQNNAMSNFWNASLFEQAYAQKGANVARKNAMIKDNIGVMEDMYWLETMLQAAGIETSSTTTGSSTVSGGIL
ncbi:hypothetical protein QUQ16_000185 [Escherichia coli]|nr:hypothetical protein [Escherichia coli]